MTDDNKIVPLEEFRRKKAAQGSRSSDIDHLLNQSFNAQEDLFDWYLYHSRFHKYKFFFKALFDSNHELKQGVNPNAAFVLVFDPSQADSITKRTEEAVAGLERKPLIVDFRGKSLRMVGESLPAGYCETREELYSQITQLLLSTDSVVIIKELSRSKIKINKTGFAEELIKTLDDAHFDNVFPSADLVFIDYASFLQKSWSLIGAYLSILPSGYDE